MTGTSVLDCPLSGTCLPLLLPRLTAGSCRQRSWTKAVLFTCSHPDTLLPLAALSDRSCSSFILRSLSLLLAGAPLPQSKPSFCLFSLLCEAGLLATSPSVLSPPAPLLPAPPPSQEAKYAGNRCSWLSKPVLAVTLNCWVSRHVAEEGRKAHLLVPATVRY